MITESRDRWLAQLYEENYRRIYCLAVYRLRQGSGRIEEAEDVVQEVFCRAIKHEVWQHENPAGWLIVATNNVCSEMYKEYIRQGKRQEKLERRIKDAKPAEVRTLFDGAIPSETEVSDIMISFEESLSREDAALIKEYCINDTPTVRLKLMKIAVRVVHSARYTTFKLCSSCPYKDEFYETLQNIQGLSLQLE